MTLKIYIGDVTEGQARLLPGIAQISEQTFWLFAESWDFNPEDLQSLTNMFTGLQGLIWYASGVPLSKLRRSAPDQRGPFTKWPSIARNLVGQATWEYSMIPGRAYSGISRLAPDTLEEAAMLLSHARGQNHTIAFVPDNSFAIDDWTNIVNGLTWLWQCQTWLATEPNPVLDADAVLLSYIALTTRIGGVPGLLVENLDAVTGEPKRALAFYGSSLLMNNVHQSGLLSRADPMGDLTLELWLRRGARFAYSP